MRFYGKVYKDGDFWLAEAPILDAMTQGHTRGEGFEMVKDLLETLVNRPGFSVTIHPGKHGDCEWKEYPIIFFDFNVTPLDERFAEKMGVSEANAKGRLYTLDYPNQEVKISFLEHPRQGVHHGIQMRP